MKKFVKVSAAAFRATTSALGLSLMLWAQPGVARTEDAPKARPNIVLVILDDVGVDAVSDMYPGMIDRLVEQYGPLGLNHPNYRAIKGRPASTPVLDRLAGEGRTFTNAWAQPFCSPTRASMLTGLYAHNTGLRDYEDWLSQKQHSLVEDLQGAGYTSAVFGKWHMAGLNQYPGMKPKEAGFALFEGNLNGAITDYWHHDYQVQDSASPDSEWRTEPAPVRSLPGIAPTSFEPVVRAADTLNWIRRNQTEAPDKPWFAWLAFNMVHITAGPQPSFVPNADTLDAKSRAEIEACGGKFGTTELGNCSPPALNRSWVNSTDTVLGIFLKELKKLSPDTYVIILGDNGTPMYGRPAVDFIDNMYLTAKGRAKGTGYESGMRVPLVMLGPDIKPGYSDALTHVVDIYSTVLDLAHVAQPEQVPNRAGTMIPLDSVSLAPVLFDGKDSVRDEEKDFIISETVIPLKDRERQVAIRNKRYKLLYIKSETGNPSCAYYDLAKDPLEEFPISKAEVGSLFDGSVKGLNISCEGGS